MPKLPLTIVTAVLNEEKNLPAFLKQATNIADEVIVVVDYRSTDESAQVAKKYGAKVLLDKGESEGIVFNNKNKGAEAAKNDWVMILDADERLSELLKVEVEKVVTSQKGNRAVIYQTGFINYEFGKFFDQCDQRHKTFVRLFKKGEFKYQTEKTAEGIGIESQGFLYRLPVLRSLLRETDPRVKVFKGKLIHDSHPTIHDFIRKIDHYSDREAGILIKQSIHPFMPVLILKLLLLPVKEFLYKYLIWKMFLEGIHGFIASALYGFYHFLIYAKYFQLIYLNSHKKDISTARKKYGLDE